MSAHQCHRLPLKSSLLFFLDLRFLKGHLDWQIGWHDFVSLASSALWRQKKKKRTKTIIESYLLRGISSHHDRLSRHRARALWFFFECATTRLPESRVKRCQIKYKMRARRSPSQEREKTRRSLFTNVNCALRRYIYFFEMWTFYTCVYVWCVYVVRSVNTNSE